MREIRAGSVSGFLFAILVAAHAAWAIPYVWIESEAAVSLLFRDFVSCSGITTPHA